MYRNLIFCAVLLGGCTANLPGEINMDMDFGVNPELLNIKEPTTPQKDVLIVLHDMSKMSLALWSRMTVPPEPYVDPMLPDMLYITSKHRSWQLEAGPRAESEPDSRIFARNFVLKPGKYKSFPKQRTLALQWPDDTHLYTPSMRVSNICD